MPKNDSIEELYLAKKAVLEHYYLNERAEGITQVIPKRFSSFEIGSVSAPVKKPLYTQIKRLYDNIGGLPRVHINNGEEVPAFLSRHLESRQNIDTSEIAQSSYIINRMLHVNQDTKNNRKKHSKEVASISRNLGENLGLGEEDIMVAEISSLCHDLGHAPFGHAGQRAMSKKLREVGVNEYIADDNIQSLLRAKEMGMPDTVMDALVYHDGKALKKTNGRYNSKNLDSSFYKFVKDKEKAPSIPAQLSAIADDIANDSRDVLDILKFKDDAPGTGKSINELRGSSKLFDRVYRKIVKNNGDIKEDKLMQKVVMGLQGEYISDVKKEYKRRSENGAKDGIYIGFSKEMKKEHHELRSSMREVFKNKSFMKMDELVNKSIGRVFDAFYNNSEGLNEAIESLPESKLKLDSRELASKVSQIEESDIIKKDEIKATEVVNFVFRSLNDRDCYELANSIDSCNKMQRLNQDNSRAL